MNNLCITYFYKPGNEPITSRFLVQFKKISRPLLPWREEVLATAKKIYQASSKPLMLCSSGGIDSELVAHAFVELKIPFTVLTLRHSTGTNEFDIKYTKLFCQKYQVPQKIVDVDPSWLFGERLDNYISAGYRGKTVFRYLQLYLLDLCKQFNCTPILAGGEQYYYTIRNQICHMFDPSMLPAIEWCNKNDREGVPYFFMHNPEIYASYMKEDIISFMLERNNYFLCPEHMSPEKIIVYHSNWPQMPRRSKFDGFEGIPEITAAAGAKIRQQFTDIQKIAIPISEIQKQLGILEIGK